MNEYVDNIIEIKEMSFTLKQRQIFTNLSLTIPRGKITAIIGSSGVGKTTLLRLISGQLLPDKGQILFDGINIPSLSNKEIYSIRKRMSMLFQSGSLFTDMNVFDNIAFPLREHTFLTEEIIRTLVIMKLEAVGLRNVANFMPNELSGGMTRRIALARATALDPQLILFDEPFVGQDPITVVLLIELIDKLKKALGMTSVIVSHDIPEVLSIADKIYIIVNQHVVAEGTVKDLQQNKDTYIRNFISGTIDNSISSKFYFRSYALDLIG